MSSTTESFGPIAGPRRQPLRLSMQRLWLSGRILPAGARLTIQHVFRSEEEKPLEAIYAFPLPRDAALRAFRISGVGFEAHSELMPTEAAVQAYERGIAAGSLAALARQYGDGLVNLTVGNVRPGETVSVYLELLAGVEPRDNGFRFRFPFTLAPAYHAHMKAAQVSDTEGEMELPSNEFGDVLLPPFRKDARSLHQVGFDLSVLHQLPIAEVGSPSHSIRVIQDGAAPARVALAAERDVPNRDLVLDVRFQEIAAQVLAGATAGGSRSFAAIVPSSLFGVTAKTPRRTVIVLDRSGSMQGAPMDQARKAIAACLATLAQDDSFGVVAFNNSVESLHPTLLAGSSENREKARAFLDRVNALGGTELAAGFLEAARLLNGSGDVLILTDGQVSGTETILAQARALNIRLFCLGIGSASQDRFLSLLARETSGISRFVTARERVDLPAVDLFASMGRPVASGLKSTAVIQPEPPSAVFAGDPVVLFGETKDGSELIELTWDGGQMRLPIPAGDPDTGQTVRLLQGSRLITDWESRYPAGEALAPIEKRKQSRIAERLSALSATYQLASREMSLVAVVQRAGDRPGELPETRVVPVGMPQDVDFAAYFPAPPLPNLLVQQAFPSARPSAQAPAADSPAQRKSVDLLGQMFRRSRPMARPSDPANTAASPESTEDLLLALASQIQPDGGMPGDNVSERAARSVASLLAFVAAGHTLRTGAFRSHVARLVEYLQPLHEVPDSGLIEVAIQAAGTGEVPLGEWLELARIPHIPWARIEKSLRV